MSPSVAVVLPPREPMCWRDGGAITTTVREFWESQPQQGIAILCSPGVQPMDHLPLVAFKPRLRSKVLGKTRDYLSQTLTWLKQNPQCRVVEVHNRAQLALNVKKALPDRQVTLYLHNDPSTIRKLSTLEERGYALELLDGFICVSRFIQTCLIKDHAAARKKTYVVYNGQSVSLKPSVSKSKRLIFCGRVIPSKGALEFAQSMERILPKHPAWAVTFVGAANFGAKTPKTEYEHQVIGIIRLLGDQGRYLGALPHSQAISEIARSEIMAIPSMEPEGLNRSLVEAMSLGVACVLSPQEAMIEAAGDAGCVVDPKDAIALDAALEGLIEDQPKRHELQDLAKKRISEKFDLNEQALRLAAIRQSLIESS